MPLLKPVLIIVASALLWGFLAGPLLNTGSTLLVLLGFLLSIAAVFASLYAAVLIYRLARAESQTETQTEEDFK